MSAPEQDTKAAPQRSIAGIRLASWKMLGLLGAANLFDHYDVSILALALPRIQASFGIAEADVGPTMALLGLGVFPALLIAALADVVGRRRVLLWTLLGFSVATLLTAFAPNRTAFVLCQLAVRMFATAEAAIAVVMIAEELRADQRGLGVGLLGALAAAGTGGASILFAFVDVLPYEWRMLYVLGAIPLVALGWLRRHLPETSRFERVSPPGQTRARLVEFFGPMLRLIRHWPARVGVVLALALPSELAMGTAYFFAAKHLQDFHAMTPAELGVLIVSGGIVSTIGTAALGWLSDIVGRRSTLVASLMLTAASIVAFYAVDAADRSWVAVAWVCMSMFSGGVVSTLQVLVAELLPTSSRSTASMVRAVGLRVGGMIGLVLEGVLYRQIGSHAVAISLLAAVLVVPWLVSLFLVPRTAGRELEEIAPERARTK